MISELRLPMWAHLLVVGEAGYLTAIAGDYAGDPFIVSVPAFKGGCDGIGCRGGRSPDDRGVVGRKMAVHRFCG